MDGAHQFGSLVGAGFFGNLDDNALPFGHINFQQPAFLRVHESFFVVADIDHKTGFVIGKADLFYNSAEVNVSFGGAVFVKHFKFPELSAVQYGQAGIHARFFVNYRICLYHCCYAPCLSLLLPAACFQRMPAPLSKFLVSYSGRPITPECEPIIFLTKPASSPSIL